MRVFVTGGTGYVGGAVVRELVAGGHEVKALARSAKGEQALVELGAQPISGDLLDPRSYHDDAASSDAIIHAAYQYSTPEALDATALVTLLRAARTGKASSFIYTCGLWVLGETGDRVVDEDEPLVSPAEIVRWRPAHERRALEAASNGLATAVIRPGIVYGGVGSYLADMYRSAEEKGAVVYIGEGNNHWSLVHLPDAARLFRLVMEKEGAGVFHAVDEHPMRLMEVAETASRAAGADGAASNRPLEDARNELGPVADAIVMDQKLAAVRSRELGWVPETPSYADGAEADYREYSAAGD